MEEPTKRVLPSQQVPRKKRSTWQKIGFVFVNSTLKTHEGILRFFVDHFYLFAPAKIGTSDLMPCLQGMDAEKRLRRILFSVRSEDMFFLPGIFDGGLVFFPQGSFRIRTSNRCRCIFFATTPDLGGRVMKSWKRDFLA